MAAVTFRCIPLQLDANAVIRMPFWPSFNERDPLLWEHMAPNENADHNNILPSPVALHVNLDKTAELTKETSPAQAASVKRC